MSSSHLRNRHHHRTADQIRFTASDLVKNRDLNQCWYSLSSSLNKAHVLHVFYGITSQQTDLLFCPKPFIASAPFTRRGLLHSVSAVRPNNNYKARNNRKAHAFKHKFMHAYVHMFNTPPNLKKTHTCTVCTPPAS